MIRDKKQMQLPMQMQPQGGRARGKPTGEGQADQKHLSSQDMKRKNQYGPNLRMSMLKAWNPKRQHPGEWILKRIQDHPDSPNREEIQYSCRNIARESSS